jgi:uncharacterized coiled-coil DUF342 family protein
MEKNNKLIDLKKKLNEVSLEKEKWFEKKESLKKDISKLIKKVQNIKKDKEKVDKDIKEVKKKRDEVNKVVQKLILEVKKFGDSKPKEVRSDFRRGKRNFRDKDKLSITDVKKKIDELELKVETEALSLTNEKKVMEEIKKLRKIFDENKGELEKSDEKRKLNKNIDEKRRKAEELHKKVQELALKSQESYKKFKEFSKKINDMNKEQEDAFDKFVKFKKDFIKVSNELNKKLKGMKIKKKKIIGGKLKEKISGVEEKLKKGGKLTKEDLLVLQADG